VPTLQLPKKVTTRANKDGTVRLYHRLIVRDPVTGKRKPEYRRLPDIFSPDFATKHAIVVAAVEAPSPVLRHAPGNGTIAALIREFRPVLAKKRGKNGKPLAPATVRAWNQYLKQIEADHGNKLVADMRKSHVNTIRNELADTPGKANNYITKLSGLLEFAVDMEWIDSNPCRGVEKIELGEHDPWPAEVVEQVLGDADDVLRFGIVTALCSGQRISDIILMREDWIKSRDGRPWMVVQKSQKTDTTARIPMHARWLAEMASLKAKREQEKVEAITLIYDHQGRALRHTDPLQSRLRKLMQKQGHVDEKGLPLYSFHGLSKNAICYLLEEGLTEEQVSAIVGKTVETVRYYGKEQKKWMLADGAAATVFGGSIERLMVGEQNKAK